MRVLIVYDRANKWGGAERFLLNIQKLFPDSQLSTSMRSEKSSLWANSFTKINTSFLQYIPFLKNRHEIVPFLMPLSFESLDMSGFDLVLSISSESAKGVIVPVHIPHINICLSPTRYLWHDYNLYFKNRLFKIFSLPIVKYLRKWDQMAAMRPDYMIAISNIVKSRIQKYYKRDSSVIYPPIDTDYWDTVKLKKVELPFSQYYLVVSRLVPYKKVDIAIKSCLLLQSNLVVVGSGNQLSYLRSISKKNIYFISDISDCELGYLYSNAEALLYPQEEDFGLSALEAQYFGLPVIGYQVGGGSEIVLNGRTGILFKHQNSQSLTDAIRRFRNTKFSKREISKNAKRFSLHRFHKLLLAEIKKQLDN